MKKLIKKGISTLMIAGALAVTAPLAQAQYYGHDRHGDFRNGAYNGGRGGYYDNRDDRYHGHGIGTGSGAAIGGVGGAALGALFGGGLKGALIGGGLGAGIGAIAGHKHQTHERHEYYRDRGYYVPHH